MPPPEACPRCGFRCFTGMKWAGPGIVNDVVWCPRCAWKSTGDPRPGWLEVEHEWGLEVVLPPRLKPQQVKTLRAISPSLAAVPAADLLASLRSRSSVLLGPFWRDGLEQKIQMLADVALESSANLWPDEDADDASSDV